MKKIIVSLFILLVMVLPLTACGKNSATIGIIGGADGPTAIFVTGGADKTENGDPSPEKSLYAVVACKQYLIENEPEEIISTITNFEAPLLEIIDELPESLCYMKLTEETGTGPYYQVTFSTTADDMLGPIAFLVNQETEIIGLFYRE